jgi:hypothetical protein
MDATFLVDEYISELDIDFIPSHLLVKSDIGT